MKLTRKAKSNFEDYYQHLKLTKEHTLSTLEVFYDLPDAMQWGVYQLWADSMGYDLNAFKSLSSDMSNYVYISSVNDECVGDDHKTREEARNAAIEKLNQLINEK